MANTNDMTVGSPTRDILRFAIPLILGYILQQMYQIIDAVIVGRWIGVSALAAVGASSSIMFLIMGFCNGACAGFAIPKDAVLCKQRHQAGRGLRRSHNADELCTVYTYPSPCQYARRHLSRCVDIPFPAVRCHTIYHGLQPLGRVHTRIGQLRTTVLFPYFLGTGQYLA